MPPVIACSRCVGEGGTGPTYIQGVSGGGGRIYRE